MIRRRPPLCASPILLFALLPASGIAQLSGATIPAGTPLPVRIAGPLPMKKGQPVRAELLYPVYANNHLVLPSGTPVLGNVIALRSDHTRRVHAVLGGDFTPFHIPVVRFTELVLPSGTTVPLSAEPATDGAPIFRAVAPPPSRGGLFHQEIHAGLTIARADLQQFLAPGKASRLLQFLYSQLPFHPQRIEPGTAWTLEINAPLAIAAEPEPPPPPYEPPARKPHFWEPEATVAPANNIDSSTWTLQAYLAEPLSSETSTTGQPIHAIVAQPVLGPDGSVAVPQGAVLVGSVTRAKPSSRFGRAGVLSFNFRQLILPDAAEKQTVETRLTGADSVANIALNSEGQAKSKPQDKIAIPLILALMAARPLDQDHQGIDQVGKNGMGGSAGLGLVGTIAGLAGGSPYAAAGIGYWGAARAIYSRWIAHGQTITFAKNTRIVVETTPRHSAPITPATGPDRAR